MAGRLVSIMAMVSLAQADTGSPGLRGSFMPTEGRHLTESKNQCSGDGKLPSTLPLCYQGSLLVEKVSVRVTELDGETGTVELKGTGPIEGECTGLTFQKAGEMLQINNNAGCNLKDAEYTVQYCSDQDKVVLHLTAPFDAKIPLERAQCTDLQNGEI
eukprot:TRINITY_DN414_c0_g1_i1.p1 TRINITY_DN414_c0_g1~~TRINITY_DN414_c0_g1_i1.p1  ORF type:complete len:158 (-),score=30.48 TRINITY_DN414_c0_g1_i1:210-683(-)